MSAKRLSLLAGIALLLAAWVLVASQLGMAAHMAAHMAVVALAAPMLAYGLRGTIADPAVLWPRFASPIGWSIADGIIVWAWHVPGMRAFAMASPGGALLEQVCFLIAGLMLWSSALGARGASAPPRRAAGIFALLFTSMHMTLLGALIGLAPRPLYAVHGAMPAEQLTGGYMADQQMAGVAMLVIGGAAYLAGGLAMLAELLAGREKPE